MSRADRSVNRAAYVADAGSNYQAKRTQKPRKSWRYWLLEWKLFKTHDTKKVSELIKQQEEYAAAAKAKADELKAIEDSQTTR